MKQLLRYVYVMLSIIIFLAALPTAVLAGVYSGGHATDTCTNGSLKGTYIYYQQGEALGIGHAAFTGVLTADGSGAFTGSQVQQRPDGTIVNLLLCNGVYEVKENCMASLTWEAKIGASCDEGDDVGNRTWAVTIGKRNIYMLTTDPGRVFIGEGTRR